MAIDKSMNLLVVDGQPTMRRIIRTLLNQIGFTNIDEANDGKVALDMVGQKKYGIIFSEWGLEPMSGLDLLKDIRASSNDNKTVPFIMVTAESKTENILAAKEAGVNNYIVKPFNADTLKTKISAVLGPV